MNYHGKKIKGLQHTIQKYKTIITTKTKMENELLRPMEGRGHGCVLPQSQKQ
jgi:hypothetical protein